MPQVKKEAVRQAIVQSAFRLFSEVGYTAATLPQIAAGARVSASTVYVYFASKLEIMFAIYDPWLRERLDRLEGEIAAIDEPEQRLHRLFTALWRDIPAENNGFANNIMQALSTATPEEGYDPGLLQSAQATVADIIQAALHKAGAPPVAASDLAQIIFMAFDGFAMNHRLRGGTICDERLITTFCRLLLGPASSLRAVGEAIHTADSSWIAAPAARNDE